MKSVRTSFDRYEGRRDRRYPLPPLFITIDGQEYSTINWSLGGFLITGFEKEIPIGQEIEGILCPADKSLSLAFTAAVVRVAEPEPGQLAVRFVDLGGKAMSVLDRMIARRLSRR